MRIITSARSQRLRRRLLAVAGWVALAPSLAGQTPGGDALPSPGGIPAPTAARGALPAATAALRPDTVFTAPGGPRVIRLSAPGSGLTALRLSVPVEETPIEAGTGLMLQILGLERARRAAQPLGVRVEGSRTPWGIAYTVVGPTEEFDYLTYILREAVAEPRPDRVELERARLRALDETERVAETAAGRLHAVLRAEAVPGALPLWGSPATLDAVTDATLRDLWRRTHRREAMSLVVVGPEPVELVLASFESAGSGAPATEPPTSLPRIPSARSRGPDVLRHWYGEARVAGAVDDPRAAVVAALVSRRLRDERPGFESDVQLWDVADVRILALTGTAWPREAAAMRRRLQGILEEAISGVGPEEVTPAVSALRFELLAAARTPWGLAAQVGRYHDATGEADAAYRNVLALDGVTPGTIRDYAAELARAPVARAEVRP